jgi:hypothetical protein
VLLKTLRDWLLVPVFLVLALVLLEEEDEERGERELIERPPDGPGEAG